jgi:hypothetical protein
MAVANAASEQSYESAASDDPVCLRVSSQPTEQLFTIKRRTYQICPECGQEFPYSRDLMRSVRSEGANAHAPLNGARHEEVTLA